MKKAIGASARIETAVQSPVGIEPRDTSGTSKVDEQPAIRLKGDGVNLAHRRQARIVTAVHAPVRVEPDNIFDRIVGHYSRIAREENLPVPLDNNGINNPSGASIRIE